jgi:hypothetical protein
MTKGHDGDDSAPDRLAEIELVRIGQHANRGATDAANDGAGQRPPDSARSPWL